MFSHRGGRSSSNIHGLWRKNIKWRVWWRWPFIWDYSYRLNFLSCEVPTRDIGTYQPLNDINMNAVLEKGKLKFILHGKRWISYDTTAIWGISARKSMVSRRWIRWWTLCAWTYTWPWDVLSLTCLSTKWQRSSTTTSLKPEC